MTKHTQKAYLFAIIVSLGGLIFGLDGGIIVGALKYIRVEFNLTPSEVGALVGAPNFGAVIALMFIGQVASIYGRKKTLLLIAFLFLISAIGSAFCVGYYSLVIARLLGGMAFTSLGVISMYIGEVAPSHMRGKAVAGMIVSNTIGFLMAYIICYLFLIHKNSNPEAMAQSFIFSDTHIWRFMIGSTMIPCIIWLVTLFIVPETPRWLMLKDKFKEAEKVIRTVNPPEVAEDVIAEIRANVEYLPKLRIWEQLIRLFDGKMKKILIIGFGLAISQAMCGMGIISYYAPIVFEEAGFGGNSAAFQTMLVGGAGVLASIGTLFIVDRFGRRMLYIAGAVAVLFAHSSIYYGFHKMSYTISQDSIVQVQKVDKNLDVTPLQNNLNRSFSNELKFKAFLRKNYSKKILDLKSSVLIKATAVFGVNPMLIVVAIFVFEIAFFLAVGPLLWVMFSEILPNSVRSIGIPAFKILGSIGVYATQQLFPWQLATFGSANTFLVYAVLAAFSLVFIIIFVPETKDKTIESIEEMLIVKK